MSDQIADDFAVMQRASILLSEGKKLALCTVVEKKGSGPREAGAKMIVLEDKSTFGTVGGGPVEREIVSRSIHLLGKGASERITLNLTAQKKENMVETGLVCGGELTVFINTLEPRKRLIVIGSGNIAFPLAQVAYLAGFSVILIDNNTQLASNDLFPAFAEVKVGEVLSIIESIQVQEKDYFVVAHGEPEQDYEAVKRALKKNPAYIGLLGSKTKAAIITQRLLEEGFTRAQLALLHTPVGLPIGAQTPQEIAVSIIAEIISISKR